MNQRSRRSARTHDTPAQGLRLASWEPAACCRQDCSSSRPASPRWVSPSLRDRQYVRRHLRSLLEAWKSGFPSAQSPSSWRAFLPWPQRRCPRLWRDSCSGVARPHTARHLAVPPRPEDEARPVRRRAAMRLPRGMGPGPGPRAGITQAFDQSSCRVFGGGGGVASAAATDVPCRGVRAAAYRRLRLGLGVVEVTDPQGDATAASSRACGREVWCGRRGALRGIARCTGPDIVRR